MVIIQSFQYGGVIRLKPSDESGSRDVKAYRDGNGRNMQIDELRHMAIRLPHVHNFPTIPGRRNPHDWARTTLRCCKCLRCGVENVSVEISAGTRGRKCSPPISPHSPEPQLKPGTCPSLVCVASIEIDCVRCLDASEANLLSKRGVWG